MYIIMIIIVSTASEFLPANICETCLLKEVC